MNSLYTIILSFIFISNKQVKSISCQSSSFKRNQYSIIILGTLIRLDKHKTDLYHTFYCIKVLATSLWVHNRLENHDNCTCRSSLYDNRCSIVFTYLIKLFEPPIINYTLCTYASRYYFYSVFELRKIVEVVRLNSTPSVNWTQQNLVISSFRLFLRYFSYCRKVLIRLSTQISSTTFKSNYQRFDSS